MRKNDRFEQGLNVVGAARRAKAFGIKTMTVVVTSAMLVSGVPTRVIAEGLQEAGVIATQDSTDQSASSSRQLTRRGGVQDQSQATDQSNTQEQPQAASEQTAQPSSQDNAAAAQNDSPSAQPAQPAQPSQQTATADIALTLNNASITYKGQVVAQPAQKVMAPTSDNFQFTVQPDNGYKLSKVTLTVSGSDRELKADANGLYTVDAADVAQSPRITLQTEQEKSAETAKEATPIEDAEGVDGESAAADQSKDEDSDEKNVGTVDAVAPADAKAADYTVEVAPAQPKISGADSVKMGESTSFTVSGFEQGQTVQWMSGNSNVATVDASGNVTGVHVGKTNITAYTAKQSVSKQIEVKRDDLRGGYYVYLYTKAEGNTDGLGLTVNDNGWYTIGRVWVKGIADPKVTSEKGASGENYNKTIQALADSDNIDLYGVNSIDINDIDWTVYGITRAYGAINYPSAGSGWTWHLDGYVKFDNSGSLVFHYKDVDTREQIHEDYTTTAKETGESYDFEWRKIWIAGYAYDHAEPKSVKVEKKKTKQVTLYYKKGTFPYTVRYLEAGTDTVLHTEKSGTGEYGSTVTENAIDIDGYELAYGTQRQQSIQLGTEGNVITFYYKKAPASYTVNYYWNGTTDKVRESKIVNTGYVNDEVTESPITVDGYTPVSADSKNIALVEGKNEINFYYYKNVDLTAKSDEVTYSGKEQSVSGFTGAPEGADFSAINVSASGTNAGTYPANFAEGTVGKVDKTEKYIVTKATDGKLVINPVTKQVVITITGHNGGEKYNGEEQSVSGYDVSGLPDGMTEDDIACAGKAEAKGTNAGTYPMGLADSQFSLTDSASKNFTSVKFNVTDGELTIAKRQIWRITPDGNKNYDGAALVCKGDLNDATKYIDPEHKSDDDGFVDGEGFAGKENFTWTEDAVLPDEYDNVVTNISYRNGTNPKNYEVHIAWGKLTIGMPSESEKHEITITANSSLDNKYDGKNHSATGFTTSSLSFTTKYGVVSYTLKNVETSNPAEKNAGDYDNTINKNNVKVVDEEGNDVTALVKLKFVDGKLVIQKRNVTLVSESKDFQYNGKSHSCEKVSVDSNSDGFVEGEDVTYKNFATIKNVGTKDNSFDFGWGTAAEGNYKITKRYGTLNVTKGDISKYVTLKTVDVSETYNGEHHIAGEATATDKNGNELKIEYQKSDGTWTTNRNDVYAVNVGDCGIVNVRVSSPANYGEGNYVTGTEKLVVNPVAITLTAKSDSKPYDGIALINNGYDVTAGKFVGDEGLASVTVSGSQTEAGKSDNEIVAYTLKKNTISTNYAIVLAKGQLEVTVSDAVVVVRIKGNTDSQKYNGNEQSVSGYIVAGVTVDGKDSSLYGADAETDFTFSGSATAARTDAGTTDMGIVADQFKNINKNFSKVTFDVKDGSMTITKREVTLTSASDEKPYDGTALANSKVTVSGDGFASDQGFTANVTGSQTEAGSSKNEFTYSLKDGTLEENYQITCEPGTLTVTANDSEVVVTIEGSSATKTYNGQLQSVEGYKVVSISSDKYTNSDFELKDTAKAERSVEGTTYMGLSENSFVNKSANFSKVTFQVTDGYITIKPKSIKTGEDMTVKKPADVPYNGKVQQQKPVVKDGDKTLVEGTDYTLSYSEDATNVGTVTVTVTGMGNYSGSVDVTYQITKRSVVLTSETASRPYDGTPLTKPDVAMTGDGFVKGEVTNIRATGSVTTVAEGEVFNAIEFDESDTFKSGNYHITKNEGKLSITELSAENGLTIKPNSVDYPYDATKHAAAAATANASVSGTKVNLEYRVKGTTDDNWTSDPATITAVNAGVTAIEVRASAANYSGYKYAEQTLTINKRTVELKSASATKVYDGTPLVNDQVTVSREGFIKSDLEKDVRATGAQIEVGKSDNTISYKLKEGVADNYNILPEKLGTLTVTAQSIVPDPENPDGYKGVTISSPFNSPYDGNEHKWVPEVKDDKGNALVEGEDYTVSYDTDNFVDVKKITVTIAGKGNYGGSVTKTYKITKAPLKVSAKSASKVYDGSALTAGGTIKGLVGDETATVKTEGSQTEVGSSKNKVVQIEWGTAKESNYYIQSQDDGVLTVTAKGVTALEVGKLSDVVYSGVDQAQKPEVKDGDKALKEGTDYKVSFSKDVKNVGTVTVTVTGKGNYTGTVERTYQITPATLTATTPSKSEVYNGKALTAEGTISGFVNGETAAFATTGFQTKVGSSTNTYAIDWGAKESTAKKSNYTVKENLGTLTVTQFAGEVVATAGNYKGLYDGQAHGVDVTVTGLPEGYTVKSAVSNATAADATEDKLKAEVDDLVIVNAQGEDVTSKLNIKKVDGTIKVLPAELTVTTDSAIKVYDGTALTAGATVTGLVDGEKATLKATGEQTQVGFSSNGYKLTFDKTAKAKNYKVVSENLGTLTVTKQSIVPSEPNTPSDNYKGVTVDEPKDAVYDGVEHKWTPVVKDADGKKLVEGAEYVVTYDTDDFIDVTTINVTITGRGNYTGTIVKSYRITKAPLHVVTGSATKVYDGTALTSATVTIDGLAKRDRIGIAVTGKQANVGSSQNTYAIDWMQTSADNYELTDELGTLTVTAAPARPTTPTTPSTPTNPSTPSTPTVPTPTPSSSDGGSAATTTVPTGDDSATDNDLEQKEEKIFDAKNPLGKFDGEKDTCWVHWYMIICAVATAAYGLFVGLRRDKHSRRLQNDLDKVLGNDDETQE